MPNHYTTVAIGTCRYDEDDALFDVGAFNEKDWNFCECVKPMPPSIRKTTVGTNGFDSDDENGWYGWAIKHWGTKWGTYDAKATMLGGDGFPVMIEFQSAWGPPNDECLSLIKDWMDKELGIADVVFVGHDPATCSVDILEKGD